MGRNIAVAGGGGARDPDDTARLGVVEIGAIVIIVTRRHWVFAAAALLAACQHTPAPPTPGPPQQVETGSTFNLRSPLAFPAGNPELLFQNERLVTAAKLSREMHYCRLTPDSGAPTTIPPGRLTVGAVSYDVQETGAAGGMTAVTRIALADQPGRPGYTMQCGWPVGGPARGFMNADQIFNAIGGQFSMDLLR
jgi:hypothetical protein